MFNATKVIYSSYSKQKFTVFIVFSLYFLITPNHIILQNCTSHVNFVFCNILFFGKQDKNIDYKNDVVCRAVIVFRVTSEQTGPKFNITFSLSQMTYKLYPDSPHFQSNGFYSAQQACRANTVI